MKQKVITLSLSASVVIGSYGQQMSKHTRSFQKPRHHLMRLVLLTSTIMEYIDRKSQITTKGARLEKDEPVTSLIY